MAAPKHTPGPAMSNATTCTRCRRECIDYAVRMGQRVCNACLGGELDELLRAIGRAVHGHDAKPGELTALCYVERLARERDTYKSRAEEAEAIANLAMAEGLRLWAELSVERTKVAKVKEIVTPPSCMSAGELLARLRGLPSHMPLFVGGTPGTHKHIEIRDRVPDLTPCLYLQDGETVASLADRLDRAIRDVREGVCGDRYTIRDDAPVWVTVDGDSKPVTRVHKGKWWATLMPPPKYSAQFKIDMVLDLLTETASENTDGCRSCGREEATFVGDECIHCIVLERDHLRHKLSAESERPAPPSQRRRRHKR